MLAIELKQNCCFSGVACVRLAASNIISRLTPSRRLISRRDKLQLGAVSSLPVDSRVVLAFGISPSQEWINRRRATSLLFRFLVFCQKNLFVCHRNKFNQKMLAERRGEEQKTAHGDM
jgi:hypothetical protein